MVSWNIQPSNYGGAQIVSLDCNNSPIGCYIWLGNTQSRNNINNIIPVHNKIILMNIIQANLVTSSLGIEAYRRVGTNN